ncbi:hypothetical protein ACXWOD_10910, partial [Streptococcus pyogenes]
MDYEEFTGNTAAVNTITIRARVSGYLEKVEFKEGDKCMRGARVGDMSVVRQGNDARGPLMV